MVESQEERLRGDFLALERCQQASKEVESLGRHGGTSSAHMSSAKRNWSVSDGLRNKNAKRRRPRMVKNLKHSLLSGRASPKRRTPAK